MKKKKPDISREKLKHMWCELNCWRVPKPMKGKLMHDEAAGAMKLIQAFIPLRELLKYWADEGAE
jgi:hypothetical protein